MEKDTADRIRSMIRRVRIKNIDDGNETQRASAEVAENVWRDSVEILQPDGFAGVSDEDGAIGIMIALGGDEGDAVLLPVSNPSKRMGGLSKGDRGLYTQHGDKFILKADGTAVLQLAAGFSIEAQSVTISTGGVTVTISAAGVAIEGGQVTHDGKNIGSDHGHVSAPPGPPGPPV